MSFNPIGAHGTDATISSATTLAPPSGLAKNVAKLLIQAIDQNIRYTLDGTDPEAAVGFRLTAGNDPIIITVTDGMTVKIIEESATATASYQWGS